jgi:hypothetical protein
MFLSLAEWTDHGGKPVKIEVKGPSELAHHGPLFARVTNYLLRRKQNVNPLSQKKARRIGVEFPYFLVNAVFHERLVGEVGHPSRLSRKGNARPVQIESGGYSPTAGLPSWTTKKVGKGPGFPTGEAREGHFGSVGAEWKMEFARRNRIK